MHDIVKLTQRAPLTSQAPFTARRAPVCNFFVDSETDQNVKVQPPTRRANTTFVFLARNNDLEGVVDTIRQMEDRFNHKYQYPWVLLNEVPFTKGHHAPRCDTE